ncbi:MAG: hypothetical protein GY789_00645 [Hyphomicrobiales bacterium]|nr:hypothetical protein [Hyphomicrobiales bacterium]MCP5001916.1 hypothetical protein [Hyphomicrobiales bacterium]
MNMMHAARQIVAQATRTPLEEVKEDSAIESLSAWDSIAHIAIILAIEERLARPLTPEAIVNVESVRTIADLLDTMNGGS